jgi:hypothetical protein
MRFALRFVALIASAAIVAWACGGTSPSQPTPVSTCSFTVSPSSLSLGASGGNAAVSVSTTALCAWTAASDRGWMTIDSGASGTGAGNVKVTVTTNVATAARSGTLTVAGQAVNVAQEGTPPPVCTIVVSPISASFSEDAASGSFTASAPAACEWTATSGDAWITITSGAHGTGTAPVGYAIARNTSVDARSGTIHVGDAVFAVAQQGDMPAACEFHVAPVVVNACMAAPSELSVAVSTGPTCGWTVTSDTPWVTLSTGASHAGPGDIRFRIGENYDAPRLGVVKVRWDTPTAGQNVQVSQAGCRYAVSTASIGVRASGGSFTFDVYQQSDPLECGGPLQNGCVWSATSDAPWLTIVSAMPKSGDDRVSFTVPANAGAPRTARITVRDTAVIVSQDGR